MDSTQRPCYEFSVANKQLCHSVPEDLYQGWSYDRCLSNRSVVDRGATEQIDSNNSSPSIRELMPERGRIYVDYSMKMEKMLISSVVRECDRTCVSYPNWRNRLPGSYTEDALSREGVAKFERGARRRKDRRSSRCLGILHLWNLQPSPDQLGHSFLEVTGLSVNDLFCHKDNLSISPQPTYL